jgi:hypothetical protein
MLRDYDLPDSPRAPEPSRPATTCCNDPTPSYDEHQRVVYCESCEAEWVPKAVTLTAPWWCRPSW